MKTSTRLLSSLLSLPPSLRPSLHQSGQFRLPKQVRPFHHVFKRSAVNPADTPGWTSIVDNPPRIVRTGKRHTAGLIVLGTTSSPTLAPQPANHSSSDNPYHRLLPWNLASTTPGLENLPNRKIRRPAHPAASPSSPLHRHQRHRRFRLSTRDCHRHLPP
jgi:hypothetical protein